MKKYIFFSLALLVWASAHAQIKLICSVQDQRTNAPISGAMVTLKGQEQPLETNFEGRVTFVVKSAGDYILQLEAFGYEAKQEQITIAPTEKSFVVKCAMLPSTTVLQPVEVTALRADAQTPVAYTTMSKADIAKRNSGRDVPFLLEQTPSVVATSDAGGGIGYTNIRVRGSDITRINVTVNGIPINDAESNGVFWVNMPDLASSTNSIQLQRGVGTSTNGSSAFGASLNMETDGPTKEPFASLHAGFGSFNTQRYTMQWATGLLNEHWWMSGRLSQIKSDGYVDRARSDLGSYYLSGGFMTEKTSVRAVVFGGKEVTYQAWYGVDSATLATDRTFNYAGAIYDDTWQAVDFYENQVDNYAQDHYQLHLNHAFSNNLKLNVSLHYTYGRGYYEEYIQGAFMPSYNLTPFIAGTDTINYTDLVRQKWLDNDFFGGIFNLQYSNERFTSILGGGIHHYEGRHFGEVIWAQYAPESLPGSEFYNSFSVKTDANVYWKNLYKFTSKFSGFVDLQVRGVAYRASGLDDDVGVFQFMQNNVFFNPKVGATYRVSESIKMFASYAVANREPNRTDLIYADPADLPKPEQLQDIEVGISGQTSAFAWDVTMFYMDYKNQLVLTGALDAVGYPIRKNVGRSHRLGVELAATWQPVHWFLCQPNFTLMQSKNADYVEEGSSGQIRTLGNTTIAYSPAVIAANTLQFNLFKGFSMALFSKYVGKQYLNNSQEERLSLPAYLLHDVRLSYHVAPKFIEHLELYVNALNLLNAQYSNNGYVYAGSPYYYPQAGINFLGGIQLTL